MSQTAVRAVVTREGKIYHDWACTSHEEIIAQFGLQRLDTDRFREPRMIRVYFGCEDPRDAMKLSAFRYKCHGEPPEWAKEMNPKIFRFCEGKIQDIMIRGKVDRLTGGAAILTSSARVRGANNCRILAMLGNAKLEYAGRGTQVHAMTGRSIVRFLVAGAVVEQMFDRSLVGLAGNYSVVESISDKASVLDAGPMAAVVPKQI